MLAIFRGGVTHKQQFFFATRYLLATRYLFQTNRTKDSQLGGLTRFIGVLKWEFFMQVKGKPCPGQHK
ncbi:MAG: hypothetical protein RI895_1335 [Actinomycetota bacterium]|jgi:hypothetical protein